MGLSGNSPGGLGAVGGGVLQGDLAPILDFGEHLGGREEFPFAVADRQFQMVQALSEDAVGGLDLEMHPGIAEVAAVVGDQGGQALAGTPLQAREQPQVHQDLEAVADADDQPAGVDKLLQGRAQGQFQAQGQDDPGPVFIAPTEAPRHRQQVIVPEGGGVLQQFGGVDPAGLGPGLIQGEGGLVVAVEAVAVEHQGLGLGGFGLRFAVFSETSCRPMHIGTRLNFARRIYSTGWKACATNLV